jgi:uncharacterized protein
MNAVSELPGRTERALCQKHLDALIDGYPDIIGALVSSVDGFEIAARLQPQLSPATMSAMTSSQLALGQAICGETAMGACLNVVIEADQEAAADRAVRKKRFSGQRSVACASVCR